MTGDKLDVRTITVFRDDNGTLMIEVVDSGPHVKDFRGTDDYEFWYRVPVDRNDALAVDEINTNWRRDRFYALEQILREPGI